MQEIEAISKSEGECPDGASSGNSLVSLLLGQLSTTSLSRAAVAATQSCALLQSIFQTMLFDTGTQASGWVSPSLSLSLCNVNYGGCSKHPEE